jgi:hypothetical protein
MHRVTAAFIGIALRSLAGSVLAEDLVELESGRRVTQTVHEYFHLRDVVSPTRNGERVLNGFLNYTHLGTDFGFLGPAELRFCCESGAVCTDLPEVADGWGGMWHSLNGLNREGVPLVLDAPYSALIQPHFQPKVVGMEAMVSGTGRLKFELKGGNKDWVKTFEFGQKDGLQRIEAEFTGTKSAQTLNWVAEPGAELCLDSVSLQVELPKLDFPTYVFLVSYAKLARCYSRETGLVRDRAHIGPDSLNNVATTGMFVLATVAARELGIVSDADARTIFGRTMQTIEGLPRKQGLLPHFVAADPERGWQPLMGAEYSTIDTALTLFSLRMAARVLGDEPAAQKVTDWMRQVDVAGLRDAEGYVIHGLRANGERIPYIWKDWGGETALVLMLQRVAAGESLAPMMEESGRTHRGIGFIAELPALFFPQFNTNAVARAGQVDWKRYRQQRLAEQKRYFGTYAPDSLAARLGLYGLSAGEGERGVAYHTAGVEDRDQRLIFPHYILMSGLMETNTAAVYDLLEMMEARGWLTPWGLVENITADGKSYVPMVSSLNAAFESLAAFHLVRAHQGAPNALYQAAEKDPVITDALKAIFPSAVGVSNATPPTRVEDAATAAAAATLPAPSVPESAPALP